VRAFATRILGRLGQLDALALNAGIDMTIQRLTTAQGHERIFATNYLGHFALTAHLFPLLRETPDARIVTVSSLAHHGARLDLRDLELEQDYSSSVAYARSKLCLLMFSLELHRRCRHLGLFMKSIPVHPGLVRTQIFDRGPELARRYYDPRAILPRISTKVFGQAADQGAVPLLFALTSGLARSGSYYGPDGKFELRGEHPAAAKISTPALNETAARQLWEASESLAGVEFALEREGLSLQ
jgi:NAD(P)-dependent dehydrogenase (short-subunit alcohol dehydrogenase family)